MTASALTDGRPITPGDAVPSPGGMGTIAGEHITATLEFEGNRTVTLLQHRFPAIDVSAYGLEVFGTEGRMFWKITGAWWLPVPHFEPGQDSEWEPLELEHPGHYDPEKSSAEDYAFTDEYVRALDEGREHLCSGSEGRHVLEMIMGIFESAAFRKTGGPAPEGAGASAAALARRGRGWGRRRRCRGPTGTGSTRRTGARAGAE